MTDLVRICHAPKADFSTAPWGVLKVVDGEVELDVAKAFNRARRMYQAGANTTNILRRGVWETAVPFDYTHPRYWILLRRYLAILRQPYQYEGFHGRGATVELEIFDGSSDKNWMYDDWPEAERLIRLMIQNTVDLPYVKLRLGNELNQPAVIPFAKKAYPVFKEYGLIPDTTEPPTPLMKISSKPSKAMPITSGKWKRRKASSVMFMASAMPQAQTSSMSTTSGSKNAILSGSGSKWMESSTDTPSAIEPLQPPAGSKCAPRTRSGRPLSASLSITRRTCLSRNRSIPRSGSPSRSSLKPRIKMAAPQQISRLQV